MRLSEVIDLSGCDLGLVSPHSPAFPDDFQDVSNNENCENPGMPSEELFAGIRF